MSGRQRSSRPVTSAISRPTTGMVDATYPKMSRPATSRTSRPVTGMATRPLTGASSNVSDFKYDDFKLMQVITKGNFGNVVLCQNSDGKFYSMTIMPISELISAGHSEKILRKKTILMQINHPFIAELLWTHHDKKFIYMLFPFFAGGELFTILRSQNHFYNDTALFYASEIVTALDYLHSKSIVYRDLKPENILLDAKGHVKLTNFDFATKLNAGTRTYTLCGTPDYLSPEIVTGRGHSQATDWWSLGILIFEMLSGFPPFYSDDPMETYKKILTGKYSFPIFVEPIAKDLIDRLLEQRPERRLSKGQDVKQHRWFKSINWDEVTNFRLVPPIHPYVKSEGDASNYEDYPNDDWTSVQEVSKEEQDIFDGF